MLYVYVDADLSGACVTLLIPPALLVVVPLTLLAHCLERYRGVKVGNTRHSPTLGQTLPKQP